MNVFGRSKPIRAMPLTTTAPKLPTNFAEKLLELETQLAYNLSVSLVSSLMQLYSTAIEYYESVHDKKYLHYKDRLQNLLSKQEVLEILSSSTPNPDKKSFQEPPKTPPVKPRQTLPGSLSFNPLPSGPVVPVRPTNPGSSIEEEKQVSSRRPQSGNFSSTIPTPKKEVDLAINSHLHQTTNASSIVKASIRSQEGDNLQQRLQARKRASSLKPQKTLEKEEKDLKVTKASKLEMYQREIEEIMEKYAEDKIIKIQMIEKKYRSDTWEGNKEDREAFMKKEIEEAQSEIIRQRKERIAFLRNKYDT